MSTTATAKIVGKVQTAARKVAKRMTQRFPEAASAGDAVRQGDVYLTLLDRVPKGATLVPTPTQLAPGTTQGSRHCLDSIAGVKAYTIPNATEFDGPVLQLAEERTVCHPEHGDWTLPAGIYGVGYQRTQDSLDRARRVQD